MRNHTRLVTAGLLTISLFSQAASASEVVQTVTGAGYEGDITQIEVGKTLTIRLPDGTEKQLDWNEVRSIRREESMEAQMARHAARAQAAEMDPIEDSLNVMRWGGATFLGTYVITAVGCALGCGDSKNAYIPLVGPFIEFGKKFPSGSAGAYAISGLLQAGGLGAVIYGWYSRSSALKLRENPGTETAPPPPQAFVEPFATPSGSYGALFSLRF